MLPTPSTSHVDLNRIYEPAEDSYLLLDTLSSAAETDFLSQHFHSNSAVNKAAGSPVILEVGTGSGVVLAFVTAHANSILGRSDILAVGSDINYFACSASRKTVRQACAETDTNTARENVASSSNGLLTILHADIASPFRFGVIDMLIFNPPYVPSSQLPDFSPELEVIEEDGRSEIDPNLLSLSYEGGKDGMEVTERLLEQLPNVLNKDRGVAYILLCQQNRPEEVVADIRAWGNTWAVEVVGRSGRQAGWEKLQIIRICRLLEVN